MLRHLLEDDGYTVLDAKDGRQAIDLLVLLGAADPALVVLDLRLPIASGSELLEVMRSYFRLSSIPVLVLSGTDMGRETRETSSSVAYLPKPLDLPRFLAVVGERATRVTSRLH
jgi:CheY-like chemotaxis protein